MFLHEFFGLWDSEDDETELPPEFFGCTQEKSLKDVLLMAPEFPSLVGGESESESDFRGLIFPSNWRSANSEFDSEADSKKKFAE